jgi:hypothetical protein
MKTERKQEINNKNGMHIIQRTEKESIKAKKEMKWLRSSKLSVYTIRFSIDYWEHQTYGTVLNYLVFNRGASVGCVKLKSDSGGRIG